jgi:hypothetical protein
MTATIDFVIVDHENVLLVPNSALAFMPPVDEAASDKRGLLSNVAGRPKVQDGRSWPPAGDGEESAAEVFTLRTVNIQEQLFSYRESQTAYSPKSLGQQF